MGRDGSHDEAGPGEGREALQTGRRAAGAAGAAAVGGAALTGAQALLGLDVAEAAEETGGAPSTVPLGDAPDAPATGVDLDADAAALVADDGLGASDVVAASDDGGLDGGFAPDGPDDPLADVVAAADPGEGDAFAQDAFAQDDVDGVAGDPHGDLDGDVFDEGSLEL